MNSSLFNPVIPEDQYRSSVEKVIKLVSEYDETFSENDVFSTIVKNENEKKQKITFRDYVTVGNKCLANHRFSAAAMILEILCDEMYMDNPFLYKGISIILERESVCEEEFFYFIRHARHFHHLNSWEVALEYLIHILQRQNYEHVSNLKTLISGIKRNMPKNNITYPLLKAYMGMFDYLDWKKNCEDISSRAFADRAIATFKEALKVPGQWDIFVLKLVEMLRYYKEYEEIESVLTDYVQCNPEHLNALIYLCTHLNEHSPDSEKLVKNLQILAKISPSDDRVLWLIRLIKDENHDKALELMFMFLDYPSNTSNCDAWKLFQKLLMPLLETDVMFRDNSKDNLSPLKYYWSRRRSVWPYVHYDINQMKLSDEQDARLVMFKARVLYMFAPEHHYIKIALEKLPEISRKKFKRLNRFIKKIDSVISEEI